MKRALVRMGRSWDILSREVSSAGYYDMNGKDLPLPVIERLVGGRSPCNAGLFGAGAGVLVEAPCRVR